MKKTFILILLACTINVWAQNAALTQLLDSVTTNYAKLGITDWDFSYADNFAGIRDADNLKVQQAFFEDAKTKLRKIDLQTSDAAHKLLYAHLAYEINLNLERIALEKIWAAGPKVVPQNGLSSVGKDWYKYYLRKWTTTNYTPEFLYEFGLKEIKRLNAEIEKMGKNASKLREIVLTDKDVIAKRYDSIEAVVIRNMSSAFDVSILQPIEPTIWPDATYNTPPGMYLNKENSTYSVSVFRYSFYNEQHKEMNMDWLFLHEAIPGHHYQACFRETLKINHPFQKLFYYAGNAEGWAAYIEYLGKDMGLYKTPQAEYGRLQWDLIRSARICIDIGIHYKGWSREEALKFWKDNIKNADDIAEREVDRCTRWPAQAISYKAGAYWIMQQKANYKATAKEFHAQFLSFSYCPLEIIQIN
jgi:uncharacterized protein (DUF885 family)